MPYAALIDWCGPFHTIEAACEAVSGEGFGEALYIAIGRCGRQHQPKIQYIGITGDLAKRFDGKHPIQKLIKPSSLRLYVGIVTSQAVSGRKASHHAKNYSIPLYLAESVLAFLMELPLNKNKRCNPPNDSVVVVNRWYKADFYTRRRRRPHSSWPDLVEYDCDEEIGDMAWHGSRRQHLSSEAVREIQQKARRDLKRAREKLKKAHDQQSEAELEIEKMS